MSDLCALLEKRAREIKSNSLAMKEETLLNEELEQLVKLISGVDRGAILRTIDELIDIYADAILANPRAKAAIDATAYKVSEEYLGTAEEYLALKTLASNRSDINTAIATYMSKEMATNPALKYRTGATNAKVKNTIRTLVAKELKSRLNDSRNILKAGGASIINDKDAYAEIKQLLEDMKMPLDNENIISYYDDEGKLVTAEVNPNLADFWNFTPINAPTGYEAFFGHAFFRSVNRLTRALQTTLSTVSFKNQWFRDWSDSFLRTGAYKGLRSMNTRAANLYSGSVVEWYKVNEPERYKDLLRVAQETGRPPEEVIWDAELSKGFAGIPGQTPTEYYKTPLRTGFNDELERTQTIFGKTWDKILSPFEKVSQRREVWNRKRAYEKGLSDMLAQGKSLEEARRWAEVARNNGTTNFWRGLKHFQMFQKTVNYFGAGVNGFKSFWKMFSLDPVGVSCRFFGGLVIPVIVATGLMLATDEETREKYKSLKEYEKKNQFIFAVNGQIFKIPIPQELGALVDMVRHTTETLYGEARTDFWKLMMNDLLGVGPVDLSEVMLIDWNEFEGDPTLWDRVGALGRSLIDQVAPPVVKSGIELITNTDLYTGERIDDSYWTYDEEGNRILVGGTQRKFALAIGRATGMSPAVIAHVTEAFLADTGADFLDAIASGLNFSKMAESAIKGLTDFSVKDYDRMNSEWKKTISSLWAEKETLLPEYNDYNDAINRAKTEEERNKLRAKRKDLITPFLDKVKTAVEVLKSKDPNGYDRYRFAAVVSLLTFSNGTTSGDTAEARQRATDMFYEARANAYQWMSQLGIGNVTDSSILGYVTEENGVPTVKYNTPTQLLALREAIMGRGDRDVAELKLLVEDGSVNLKKGMQEVYNQRSAIFNKGNLTDSDYDQLDAIYVNWNARVASAIRPYLERMTAEEVLANDKVMDYLEDLFLVPGDYAINNKGRYVSLGSRGNKNDAYVRSYIKALYGVK